jgi:hypothetical protein
MLADGIMSFCEGFEALAVHDTPYATVDIYISKFSYQYN